MAKGTYLNKSIVEHLIVPTYSIYRSRVLPLVPVEKIAPVHLVILMITAYVLPPQRGRNRDGEVKRSQTRSKSSLAHILHGYYLPSTWPAHGSTQKLFPFEMQVRALPTLIEC